MCPFHLSFLPRPPISTSDSNQIPNSDFKICFLSPQALPESGSLRLTTAGRGGLSDVYLYELTSGEALMRDALTLPGSMALEAALVSRDAYRIKKKRIRKLEIWNLERLRMILDTPIPDRWYVRPLNA
jgi:hypothetical protein